MSVLIIAEAGVNHNGDMQLARQLIEVAAEAGADLVKFQTFSADRMVTPDVGKAEYQVRNSGANESQRDMLRRLELSPSMHEELIAHCETCGVGFFSTGFDEHSVDMLLGYSPEYVKIPSGELTNLPFLRHVGACGKRIILSTGMATLAEVTQSVAAIEAAGTARGKMTVLHCTTAYPAAMTDVNLQAMATMAESLGVAVGYSDHTEGIEIACAAVALGATIVEKHFTLDRSLPGPDHRASLEPAELKAMVRAIRNIEAALGDGEKRVAAGERANIAFARKSLVTACPVAEGERFSAQNVVAMRPGSGLSPMRWDDVIGQAAQRDYQAFEIIEL